jgi:transcriptional regulator GlxA family with amidase domain
MRIEIPLFPGFDEIDAVAPFEVLRGAGWDVHLVGAYGAGEVLASHGARLAVDTGLGSPDALLVPGGGWGARAEQGAWGEVQRGDLPRALAALAPRCQWVASVCTGAMLLAAAGLTAGRPAVTHAVALEDLAASGAEVIADARVVDDGNLLTAGGVTAGLDLALWLIEREDGPGAARAVARALEHERRGPIWRASA